MDEIDGESLCLFDRAVVILFYANNVIMLFKLGACLQRLLYKLHEFCTSSILEVNLSRTKIMIFGRNKRNLNQETLYLDKDRIEITRKYEYFGIDLY